MQFVNNLFSKVLWALLVVVLLASGYIFLVRNLVKPPQITNTPTQPDPDPNPQTTPTNSNSSTLNNPDDFNPDLVGGTDVIDDVELSDGMMPALAQAEDVVLEMPEKLEPGGILKYYLNTTREKYPDPVKYSPIKVYKTEGLELISIEPNSYNFQEVFGYFLVDESANYNFIVNIPTSWNRKINNGDLHLKIDGFRLPNYMGGKVYLEKGWHKIDYYLYFVIKSSYPTIAWGKEGEVAKPLKVWREVEEKKTEATKVQKPAEEKSQKLVKTSEE